MGSALTTVLLPLALALVMFGLGLSLTVGDFARVGRQPKAVVIALALQLLVLPGDLLRAGAGLRPAAAAGGRPAAARGLARRHDGEPVQPPVPRGRGPQHHADRGELADRRGDPAGDHQPRDRLLRPGRRRQPRPAVRQDPAGVRRRARPGRPRAWWSGSGRPRSPTGWTSRCGSSPRWCSPWSSSARSSPSARTSPATCATSACPRCCSASPASPSGSSSPVRSAWSGGRRSRARSRSACTTARWRSPSRSACWAASSSPSLRRSTA